MSKNVSKFRFLSLFFQMSLHKNLTKYSDEETISNISDVESYLPAAEEPYIQVKPFEYTLS